eukprot:CAMPEP_0197638048 /NCGR_PEP_ID=MMETSP1338-20131121/13083_1 /TAXON_ID=43686 ORGANISM="Pelagodinium beii, Strain RCC1491" /NCGR_SAMPLE_ID=MMETSP1338 /ASSEMBLY_ACC=CAM_ASM_000754 /LENGTH=340 /DNA_ID=CAMNT_0043210561 /DNA_START=41 /DNA_END=1059 /DNA_ORIENTATION=-
MAMNGRSMSIASVVSLEQLHSGLSTVEDFIPNVDKQRLLYRRYDPDLMDRAVAQLCIIHGFGEHSGRYVEFARALSEQGIVVHTIDMRGFGMSGGSRCQQTIHSFTRDVAAVLRVCSKGPGAHLPVFLFGHSLGGLTVLKYCIDNPDVPLAGVIFSSGLFRLVPERTKPWLVRKAAYGLTAVSEIVLMPDVDFHSLTRDSDRIRAPYNDRLCVPLSCGKLAADMLNVPFQYVRQRLLRSFKFPVLLYHGTGDRLTWFKGSELVYNLVSSSDKTLKLFEGGFHELHQDIVRDEVIGLLAKWIRNRCNAAGTQKFRKDLVPVPAEQSSNRLPVVLGLLLILG